MTLQDLILLAYDLQSSQLSGPSWLPGDRFQIQAKVPEGATAEQLKQMVRRLLAERFGLVAHRERKKSDGSQCIHCESSTVVIARQRSWTTRSKRR